MDVVPVSRLHALPAVALGHAGGAPGEQAVGRLHRVSVHLDEETVTVQGSNPPVGDLESTLPGRIDEIADVPFFDIGVALLHGADHGVERHEAIRIHFQAELVGAVAQHQREQL